MGIALKGQVGLAQGIKRGSLMLSYVLLNDLSCALRVTSSGAGNDSMKLISNFYYLGGHPIASTVIPL